MKYSICSILCLAALLSIQDVKAQSTLTANFSVSQIVQPMSVPMDTLWAKNFVIALSDTTNVLKFHMKMGTTQGGSEIFNDTITFDQTVGLPSGFSYNRDGAEVKIRVGDYSYGFFYYELKLEGDSAVFSPTYTWNSGM